MLPNTLLLRLEGYLQSWGERGRWTVRDTALTPTKSGVIGLLCAALGDPDQALSLTRTLTMGVMVERVGEVIRDFHTVTTGTLAAKGGLRGDEDDPSTLLSNRYYLCGTAFVVALMGDPDLVERLKSALLYPKWALYLGRKCCIPSAPILIGTAYFDSLQNAVGGGAVELECEPYAGGIVRMDSIKSGAYRSFEPRYVCRKGFPDVSNKTSD